MASKGLHIFAPTDTFSSIDCSMLDGGALGHPWGNPPRDFDNQRKNLHQLSESIKNNSLKQQASRQLSKPSLAISLPIPQFQHMLKSKNGH